MRFIDPLAQVGVVRSRQHSIGGVGSGGFSLAEVAIVIAIAGIVVQGVVKGQELIHNARVHDVIAQQAGVEQAVLAFQDRLQALPGDYAEAHSNIACVPGPCLNGNGNGRIEPGTDGAIEEDILVWQHLAGGGFLREGYEMLDPGVSIPTHENNARNVFGGFLQVVFEAGWGHSVKTGNLVPAAVLAEVDRKTDDGLPGSGRFRFSTYAGSGVPPVVGECVDSATPGGWTLGGSDNCGAATLLR